MARSGCETVDKSRNGSVETEEHTKLFLINTFNVILEHCQLSAI